METIPTQRAKGPQILASTLCTETWHHNAFRNDPRLDLPCIVWSNRDRCWWKGPAEGVALDENEAHAWTARVLFDVGYLGTLSTDTTMCFLAGVQGFEIPPAEKEFYRWTDAMVFLADKPNRKFIVLGQRTGRYQSRRILESGSASVAGRNEAAIFGGQEINDSHLSSLTLTYEILPEGWEPPKQKVPIEHILQGRMIEALQAMPENPAIRTQVWSILKSPIPEDKKTYDEIKSWIEENYDPKPSGLFREPPPGNPPSDTIRPGGIQVTANTSRRVYGTCHYTATETGSGIYNLSDDEITDAARKAAGNYTKFAGILRENLVNTVIDDPPDNTEESRHEYSDHEQGDSGGLRVDVLFEQNALEWLRRYHPDLAEKLDPGYLEDGPLLSGPELVELPEAEPDDDENQ